MKILLAAVNAKYIHSNLAVHTLAACAREKMPPDVGLEVAGYTINEPVNRIFADICRRRPDMIAFSCYIWNMPIIRMLIRDLKKVMPDVHFWVGGPEVSFDPEEELRQLPELTGVMVGEGEKIFTELVCSRGVLRNVEGIVYRDEVGQILRNPGPAEPVDMDSIPFFYRDESAADWAHHIIYYESSRGCPFRCSYCLSAGEKKVRLRSLSLVLPELQFFLDARVPQVKFVDRTFNCDHERTLKIWTYLRDHDNGITNFHFEIEAELLTDEEIRLLNSLRPGQVQLEIGVQSTNGQTLEAVHRRQNFFHLSEIVRKIAAGRNVHQHLDLIAGLPLEGLESFHRSFNDVYSLKPHQLQLGFLKVLKGSDMEKRAADYGIRCQSHPPYEVLVTDFLSCDEVLHLHDVCDAVDLYYNSLQYSVTIGHLTEDFGDAFHTFEALAAFEKEENAGQEAPGDSLAGRKMSRTDRISLLRRFAAANFPEKLPFYEETLLLDLYLRENSRKRPAWAGESELQKQVMKKWMAESRENDKRMAHVEIFIHDVLQSGDEVPYAVLFTYDHRDPLTGNALTKVINHRRLRMVAGWKYL